MVVPVVLLTDTKGTTTVTSEEIVYHQRVRMLAHAVETGNVTETCRVFGVSTKTFHKWRNVADLVSSRPCNHSATRRNLTSALGPPMAPRSAPWR